MEKSCLFSCGHERRVVSLVAAMSREEMIHCHHLHDFPEVVNSPTLFQSLTVLGRILYTAGLPGLTLKQCSLFSFS